MFSAISISFIKLYLFIALVLKALKASVASFCEISFTLNVSLYSPSPEANVTVVTPGNALNNSAKLPTFSLPSKITCHKGWTIEGGGVG